MSVHANDFRMGTISNAIIYCAHICNVFGIETIPKWFVLLLGIGFIGSLWFSWIYDVTPQGLRRETEVDAEKSITSLTGRKIDCAILITIILGLAVFLLQRVDL